MFALFPSHNFLFSRVKCHQQLLITAFYNSFPLTLNSKIGMKNSPRSINSSKYYQLVGLTLKDRKIKDE